MLRGKLDPFGMPRVQIAIRGPYGTRWYDAIVDAGLGATLGLGQDEIQRLGLLKHGVCQMKDARNKIAPVRTYWSDVEWFQTWIGVEVVELGIDEALIGAGLLRGHEVVVDYRASWSVEIR